MSYSYSQHHSFPRYFYIDNQPASPGYATINRKPHKCELGGIRVMKASYYRSRINTDRLNRVMDQRSDYLFIDRKPDCLCHVEREDFGTPVRNVQRDRMLDYNYDCFNNKYFQFRAHDPPSGSASSRVSIRSDGVMAADRFGVGLPDANSRRCSAPMIIAQPSDHMARNPGYLAQIRARSHVWPHNAKPSNRSLRARIKLPDNMPFNVTYNNNNTSNYNNNNNNNNGNDMNNYKNNKDIDEYCKEREKIGQRRQVAAALVMDDKKMRAMRRSYRYVPPAPSQYPHASIPAGDRYAQLGQVLRGNIMIGSTFRENTSTEFRRSYSQDVADRRVAETDEFNMKKDELCAWREQDFMRIRLEADWRAYVNRIPTQKPSWDRTAKRPSPLEKPAPKKALRTKPPRKRPSKIVSKTKDPGQDIEVKTPPLSPPPRKTSKDLVAVPEFTRDDEFWSFYDQK